MRIRFIGDVHGKIDTLRLRMSNTHLNIQLGDLGFGFVNIPTLRRFKFIRGNHDNPAVARKSPMYLGEYGQFGDIFFVSGAYSVDKNLRTPGLDWWDDEEIKHSEWYKIFELYENSYARIVISHDAPASVTKTLFGFKPTTTSSGLEEIFNICKPDIWLFGHHHMNLDTQILGTRFVCLNELRFIDLEI